MALYNVCFCISDMIEAEDETEALEKLTSYIKDMRFGEICGNTDVKEIEDNEEKQNTQIH